MIRPNTREVAYNAIDTERNYQDRLWGSPGYGDGSAGNSIEGAEGARTIDAFVCYMQGYMNKLVHVASTTADPVAKLHAVRKVAALGVACMEQHGAPYRERT